MWASCGVGVRAVRTPGGAGDPPVALPQTGAVHHHPALVRLLPRLPHHVGQLRAVVIATLGCGKGHTHTHTPSMNV